MLKIRNFDNHFLYDSEVSRKDKVEITKLKEGEKPFMSIGDEVEIKYIESDVNVIKAIKK